MAKQLLSSFRFNEAINDALKSRFGAKWDHTEKRWHVNGKEKAQAANALVESVQLFEKTHYQHFVIERELYDFHIKNPHIHALVEHPLTKELWVARILSKEVREQYDLYKKSLKQEKAEAAAEEIKEEAAETAIHEASKAGREAKLALQIASVAPALEKAAAIVARAALLKAEAAALSENLTKGIIDIKRIVQLQAIMQRESKNIGAAARDQYKKAQNEIREVRSALASAGLYSRGISDLATMNFNRPDRDIPMLVSRDDILDVKEKVVTD